MVPQHVFLLKGQNLLHGEADNFHLEDRFPTEAQFTRRQSRCHKICFTCKTVEKSTKCIYFPETGSSKTIDQYPLIRIWGLAGVK